jgi:hypothetical protein
MALEQKLGSKFLTENIEDGGSLISHINKKMEDEMQLKSWLDEIK